MCQPRWNTPASLKARIRRAALLKRRLPSLWRYRELLPVDRDENIVSLGEGMSPLIPCHALGKELGLDELWIKDESQLPTGSFKSRGLCMAVSRAKELGVTRLAIPTAGNAGGALAAYAARAGLEAYVLMPTDTPIVNRYEAGLFGAKVYLVDGLINECGAIVHAGVEAMEWFDCSTLKEPYRLEGKKTMGLELAEQFRWSLPDAILYPTGGGTGLIGMWKAFGELEELDWIQGDARPRMYACQSSGCAPIVTAYEAGERHAEPFPNPETIASGQFSCLTQTSVPARAQTSGQQYCGVGRRRRYTNSAAASIWARALTLCAPLYGWPTIETEPGGPQGLHSLGTIGPADGTRAAVFPCRRSGLQQI